MSSAPPPAVSLCTELGSAANTAPGEHRRNPHKRDPRAVFQQYAVSGGTALCPGSSH